MRTDESRSNKKFYVEPGKALSNLLARLSLIADELEHVTIRRVQLGQSTPFAWKHVIAQHSYLRRAALVFPTFNWRGFGRVDRPFPPDVAP
jgi:hypothetical protein